MQYLSTMSTTLNPPTQIKPSIFLFDEIFQTVCKDLKKHGYSDSAIPVGIKEWCAGKIFNLLPKIVVQSLANLILTYKSDLGSLECEVIEEGISIVHRSKNDHISKLISSVSSSMNNNNASVSVSANATNNQNNQNSLLVNILAAKQNQNNLPSLPTSSPKIQNSNSTSLDDPISILTRLTNSSPLVNQNNDNEIRDEILKQNNTNESSQTQNDISESAINKVVAATNINDISESLKSIIANVNSTASLPIHNNQPIKTLLPEITSNPCMGNLETNLQQQTALELLEEELGFKMPPSEEKRWKC